MSETFRCVDIWVRQRVWQSSADGSHSMLTQYFGNFAKQNGQTLFVRRPFIEELYELN